MEDSVGFYVFHKVLASFKPNAKQQTNNFAAFNFRSLHQKIDTVELGEISRRETRVGYAVRERVAGGKMGGRERGGRREELHVTDKLFFLKKSSFKTSRTK